MLIGLTGGIGSGKTTVAKLFAKYKEVVIYFADDEAKKLMHTSSVIKTQLRAEFSDEVYVNGILNRAFLAKLVFNNKEKLKKLNSIVHPIVHKHLQDFINNHRDKQYIIYENAILFENGSNTFCDKIITVTAPELQRIERVMKRDGISKKEVQSRLKNQWSDEKKILQSNYIIENVNLKDIEQQVSRIHNKLTEI